MLHPSFDRTLAAARIEDLHRAAARRQAIRVALRVAAERDGGGHSNRDAAIRVDSAAGRRDGVTPTEIPQAEGIRSS
jgi:hypothetical protein